MWIELGARRAQHREDLRRRPADERHRPQLGAGINARVHRVEIAARPRIVAQERRDLNEAIAIDVDDEHVVKGRDASLVPQVRDDVLANGPRDRARAAARSVPIQRVLLPRVIEADDEDPDEDHNFDKPGDAELAEQDRPWEEEDHFDVEHDEEQRKHVEVRRISTPRLPDRLLTRFVRAQLFRRDLLRGDQAARSSEAL